MVESVFGPSEPSPDCFVCDFELLSANTAVVVPETDTIVAPDEGCAASTTAGRHAWFAFARFTAFSSFWGEPVENGRGRREGSFGRGLGDWRNSAKCCAEA